MYDANIHLQLLDNITGYITDVCRRKSSIRSILNQQPLAGISDDCRDFEVLTPSHFLIGVY